MVVRIFLIVQILCVGLLFGQSSNGKVSLVPCDVVSTESGKTETALCGKHEVFEDRERKTGRKIALKIVVYPATGGAKEADPFLYIPGGPGSSATEDAPYFVKDFAKIRERRDLVFIDQRGTGGSNPLVCTFFDSDNIRSYLGHWNPPELVKECRKDLEKKADLRLYTTSIAVEDLDEVRAALEYAKVNLFGGSYGTRVVQEYIRRHGGNVRSVVMQGVSLTSQYLPATYPADTQRALDGVLDECLADEACRGIYPNIKSSARTVLANLVRGPVSADVELDGKKSTVSLSRDLAAEAIRYMLYQAGSASRIPWVLNHAANGNYTPLAEAAIFYRQVIVATGATGMYLSVTCAEDLPWIDYAKSEKSGTDTFLGNYRLHQQRDACSLWVQGEIPKDFAGRVKSRVPALILTGQWDPVTPPSSGDTAAKHLPNALHVVVPSGGHGFNGLAGAECLNDLTTAFVAAGTTKNLDVSCAKSIKRQGFQLK
jgi:pimeloyl-ACP methyl ester carboxylesterase